MKVSHRHRWLAFALVFFIIMVLVCWSVFQSGNALICTSYSIHSDKITKPIRVVQLTDLHNSIFGKDNRRLIDLVKEQLPDLILITGDLLNSGESETKIAEALISNLCGIAPVYVSLGNHEVEYQERYGVDMAAQYEAAGAVVLDKQYRDITVNGQQIRLGGIYGYCLPAKFLKTGEADPEDCAFLEELENTGFYTILMCHMPVCWLINDGLDEWKIDCVFSGHVHGGQVILPFIGGVYAPDMGWFPGRLEGAFYSENGKKTLILSRGLGNMELIPRWNNTPEIVAVNIVP